MVSPQKENGYTAIANEIMEALAGIRISGEARQCLDVIFRKTYGFNKKEDYISLSQFCLLAKMPKPEVCRALRKLVKMNIIVVKKANGNINSYRILKDYSNWKPLAKKPTVGKKANQRWQKCQSALAKMPHTKDTITKDTITKDILSPVGDTGEIIPNLLKDKQKHIRFIGLYAHAKKISFTSKEHQSIFIRRNLKAASDLITYKTERIMEVMAWLTKNANFKWTLESVGKYIDENLNNLNNKGTTFV